MPYKNVRSNTIYLGFFWGVGDWGVQVCVFQILITEDLNIQNANNKKKPIIFRALIY